MAAATATGTRSQGAALTPEEIFLRKRAKVLLTKGDGKTPACAVRDKVDLASDTTVCVPVILDLVARQAVWADIAIRNRNWINNSLRNEDNLARVGRALTALSRPNLYDLFAMHAEARGQLVEDRSQ